MRRTYLRLVISFLIGPAGLILHHYSIDRGDHFKLALQTFWWSSVAFFAWTIHEYETWPYPRCGLPWQDRSRTGENCSVTVWPSPPCSTVSCTMVTSSNVDREAGGLSRKPTIQRRKSRD
jgi:hypothetical protein